MKPNRLRLSNGKEVYASTKQVCKHCGEIADTQVFIGNSIDGYECPSCAEMVKSEQCHFCSNIVTAEQSYHWMGAILCNDCFRTVTRQ